MELVVQFFSENPETFILVIGILSLFIGSLLNVIIYRLPKMMAQEWSDECRIYLGLKPQQDFNKINLWLPFSHCPECKNLIKPWHNIPLVSYIFLGAKCAFCKTHISIRYPLVEALTCIASVYIAWKFGLSWQTFGALLFTWFSICLIFIDIDYHLLPDQLTLSLLWIGLFLSIFNVFVNSHEAILGALIGYLIFASIQWIFGFFTGKTGMGQGDYKYLAALGSFLGWQGLPLVILLASISGVIFSGTFMLVKRQFKSEPLPFGPYLAIAGWITLLWGSEILQYYFQWM